MLKLTFNPVDVQRIVAHTLAAAQQSEVYGLAVDEPSVLLVKDEGVYLMSNGNPPDLREHPGGGNSPIFVTYADGFGPLTGDDAHGKVADALGDGSDFAEPLPAASFTNCKESCTITVTKDAITVVCL